jgi:hypothetical protein
MGISDQSQDALHKNQAGEIAALTEKGTPVSGDWVFINDSENSNAPRKAAFPTGGGSGTVDTSGTPVANDIARFTDADTIEGRSYAEFRSDINVEDGADVTDAANVNSAGAVMESDVDAKGDIFVGTADNTVTRLAVGLNTYVFTADSTEASGTKWAAADGGAIAPTSVSASGNVLLAYANGIVKCVTNAFDLTIQAYATVAIPVGSVVKFYKTTANAVGIAKGAGVTFSGPLGDAAVDIDGTYAWVSAYHESTNVWILTGAVKAAA